MKFTLPNYTDYLMKFTLPNYTDYADAFTIVHYLVIIKATDCFLDLEGIMFVPA